MASRKNLLATVLLLCVVAGAGTAASQVEIPFRQDVRNKLIFLDARINGKPALLLMDCGATITIVNARLLEIGDWDLRASKFSTEGPGFGGEAKWADADLALGSTKGDRRRVAAMNLEAFTRSLGHHIDGLLGQDFLSEFDHVVIDFKAKKLLLYR
jgi:Aspartyl protease